MMLEGLRRAEAQQIEVRERMAREAAQREGKDFASIIEGLNRSRGTSVKRARKVHGNHKMSYDANRERPER
jgi:hypothetical protein